MYIKKIKYKNSLGYGLQQNSHHFKKCFEWILLKFGKTGIWIFRNKKVYDDMPKTNE